VVRDQIEEMAPDVELAARARLAIRQLDALAVEPQQVVLG